MPEQKIHEEEQEYRVYWTIDVSASSPRDAAEFAQEIRQDPRSIATVFEVQRIDTTGKEIPGTTQTIDLGSKEDPTRRD